jgi:hypothetical protein
MDYIVVFGWLSDFFAFQRLSIGGVSTKKTNIFVNNIFVDSDHEGRCAPRKFHRPPQW